MITLEKSEAFERAYQFANETNQSIFLTGKAGTGKTTLLKYIRQSCLKQMAVVAPTGVAAINAGGTTIHSFFQLPFAPFLPSEDKGRSSTSARHLMEAVKLNGVKRKVIRELELLIIDEISMVRCDVLDAIDVVMRSVRQQYHLPFGGVQVIMVGDMYQLPPVVNDQEWNLLRNIYASPYFFDSQVTLEVKPVYIELDKIYRQDEPQFIDLLNKVRNNEADEQAVQLLNSRMQAKHSDDDTPIVLTTHNHIADGINEKELGKITTKLYTYSAEVTGTFSEKAYPAEEHLKLKEGARVMFIKNDQEKRYYNGKAGIVTRLSENAVFVKCDGEHHEILVTQDHWDNIQYNLNKAAGNIEENIIGSFIQFPLRLAWAITIHKSQGLTFDKVVIDAAQAFSPGQVYVALSRCRSLEGIVLRTPVQPRSLMNDQKIVAFASAKPHASELNSQLAESRKLYYLNIISDLYNFLPLQYSLEQMARVVETHKKYFDGQAGVWAGSFDQKVAGMIEVAAKFKIQLTELINQGDKQLLDERLQKAATYFIQLLSGMLAGLAQCPLSSESKTAATEVLAVYEDIYEWVTRRIHILGCFMEPFDLQVYARVKQTWKPVASGIKIYAVSQKQQLDSSIPHPELYSLLEDLRDTFCNETGRPIYMVANKKTLMELCKFLPTDGKSLLKISGFGAAKVEAMGAQFLEVINTYMQAHGLVTNMDALGAKKAKAKDTAGANGETAGSNSKQASYDLYKQGLSIAEIAKQRNFVESTIESHLTHYISTGDLNIDLFLSASKLAHLNEVAASHPDISKFGELKALCKPEITYSDLKYFMAHRGSKH
jgi:GTPase SAR1 family protein